MQFWLKSLHLPYNIPCDPNTHTPESVISISPSCDWHQEVFWSSWSTNLCTWCWLSLQIVLLWRFVSTNIFSQKVISIKNMNLQKIPFKLLIKTKAKVVQAFLNQTFDRDPNQSFHGLLVQTSSNSLKARPLSVFLIFWFHVFYVCWRMKVSDRLYFLTIWPKTSGGALMEDARVSFL